MFFKEEEISEINNNILIWLATVDEFGVPSVSPKEVYWAREDCIYIANIASPNSVENIQSNSKVGLSTIHPLVQKGYKIKGEAVILTAADNEYLTGKTLLEGITKGRYPFVSIIKVIPISINKIVAPSYFLYPEQSVKEKVQLAKESYNMLDERF